MLLVEEYLSQGSGRVPFYMARQAADELLAAQENADGDGTVPVPAHLQGVPTAAENDAALAELQTMMGSLRRA